MACFDADIQAPVKKSLKEYRDFYGRNARQVDKVRAKVYRLLRKYKNPDMFAAAVKDLRESDEVVDEVLKLFDPAIEETKQVMEAAGVMFYEIPGVRGDSTRMVIARDSESLQKLEKIRPGKKDPSGQVQMLRKTDYYRVMSEDETDRKKHHHITRSAARDLARESSKFHIETCDLDSCKTEFLTTRKRRGDQTRTCSPGCRSTLSQKRKEKVSECPLPSSPAVPAPS